jgi:hypothetical protein
MLATQLRQLLDNASPGLDEVVDVVTGFDDGLVHGLARVGEERAAALAAFAAALATTPLRDRVREAVEKVSAGSVNDEYLLALAGGRAALLGAVHDELSTRLATALDRTRVEGNAVPVPLKNTADHGARSWLRELAITGWRGVDDDLLSAADQVRQSLFAQPETRRLAVLLDGLAAELRASSPIATMDRIPVRRWADLWARALLLTQPAAPISTELVSGRLLPLGVDVHEHATAVQVQLHGVLEPTAGMPRLVRTSVSATKVDTIAGPAVWQLLGRHPILLTVLAERRSVEVTDLALSLGGDLIWRDDRVRAGEPADPFATARIQLAEALAPAVPPLDRHPVRIAEPVLIEEYGVMVDGIAMSIDLGGATIDVDVDRLPACGPLTPELVAGSSRCLGLVRWDGGRWLLQPLAVESTVRRKVVAVHTGDWAMGVTGKTAKAKAGGDAVSVLRERAGRLLRT